MSSSVRSWLKRPVILMILCPLPDAMISSSLASLCDQNTCVSCIRWLPLILNVLCIEKVQTIYFNNTFLIDNPVMPLRTNHHEFTLGWCSYWNKIRFKIFTDICREMTAFEGFSECYPYTTYEIFDNGTHRCFQYDFIVPVVGSLTQCWGQT